MLPLRLRSIRSCVRRSPIRSARNSWLRRRVVSPHERRGGRRAFGERLLRAPFFCVVSYAAALGCAVIAAHALPAKGGTPHAMPASVERAIDRLVAEIDRIETETLTQ